LDRCDRIGAPHLMAAMALWDYCSRSVYYVFGESLGDPVADELLQLLRGCPKGMTRTDLSNHFGRHQSADRIAPALRMLLRHGLARRGLETTAGRPAERWFAVVKGKQGT